jgi:hypothetical protein
MLDWIMRGVNDLRAEALADAAGDVLEEEVSQTPMILRGGTTPVPRGGGSGVALSAFNR